ncbi:MAG: cysteine desulfurase family protein [bacterium]
MRHIYADYAATTPVDKRVLKIATPYFSKNFGNPSSVHAFGTESKKAINKARQQAADFFNCGPEEIIFTSGGTESENLAIKGIAFSNRKHGNHIIISSVEHAAVESSASFTERQGLQVTRVPVDRNCLVNVKDIESSLRDDTILVSVMYVNNEVGSIQPIKDIAGMLKRVNEERQKTGKHPIRFHVDGEAGSICLDYDTKFLGVDSISVNGSKIYSLKGASALCVKKGSGLATQICGGGQEFLFRGGTENVPAIVALGEALTIVRAEREKNKKRIFDIKKRLIDSLKKEIKNVRINTPENGAPNMLHVTFLNHPKVDIVGELSNRGIYVSSGSACASNKSSEKSRVLQAMGFSEAEIDMSIRFSLGKFNKKSDIKHIVGSIKKILKI